MTRSNNSIAAYQLTSINKSIPFAISTINMRTTTIATAAASLLSLTSARIVGIAAPRTVAVNSEVKLQIIGENYIQTVNDVAIAFGVQPAKRTTPDTLGVLVGSKYLGPGK